MKKVFTTVVALALMSSVTAAASAANRVWFQTNGTATATGGVVCSGGPGGAGTGLALGVNDGVAGGTCTWPIRLMLDYGTNGTDDGIYGWALDLYTDSPNKVTAAFTGYQSTTQFPTANEFPPNGPDPRGYSPILTGKGHTNNAAFQGIGTYALMDFTITITKSLNDRNTKRIYVRIGNGGWGVDDPTGAQSYGGYQFGDNPAPAPNEENGIADSPIGPNPLITIVNTPEPATMSLLALGGLALIRRRR